MQTTRGSGNTDLFEDVVEKGIVTVVVHALRIKWEVRVRGRVRGTMELREDCNRDFKEVGTWGRKNRGKLNADIPGREFPGGGNVGEIAQSLKGSIRIILDEKLI